MKGPEVCRALVLIFALRAQDVAAIYLVADAVRRSEFYLPAGRLKFKDNPLPLGQLEIAAKRERPGKDPRWGIQRQRPALNLNRVLMLRVHRSQWGAQRKSHVNCIMLSPPPADHGNGLGLSCSVKPLATHPTLR